MTFEEFFIKKKIDLKKLRSAEPLLYQEFQSHFTLMGEKSFDHTKKFWFNRLRKIYHLADENMGKPKEPALTTSPLDENKAIAAAEAPQATKPSGFKPRFKAANKPIVKEEQKAEPTPTTQTQDQIDKPSPNKPAGFTPRFKKAATSKSASNDQAEQKSTDQDQSQPISSLQEEQKQSGENRVSSSEKPLGFKPRFKAGVTPKIPSPEKEQASEKKEPQDNTSANEKPVNSSPTKPLGFKPRFKAGVTTTDKGKAPETTDKEADKIPEQTKEENANSKPLGFKPRFKAGLTDKPKAEEGTSSNHEIKEGPSREEEKNHDISDAEEGSNNKPLGFKPRFRPSTSKKDKPS